MPGVRLTGVADVDPREVDVAVAKYGTRGYLNHRELIGRVDAVSIAVPTAYHYEVARDFVDAGIHALVEKPMTATVEEAQRLAALSTRQGTVMVVGHVERFKPAVQHLSSLIEEPLFIHTRRVRPYDPSRVMDVGVVLDLMIHDLDIVLSLVRDRVVEIGGVGVRVHNSHEDLAVAHLSTAGGCRMTLTASRVSAVKATELEITMADRAVHLDYLREVITIRRFDGEVRRLALDGEEPLRAELAHFVSCIRGDERPRVSADDGLRALEVSHQLLKNMVDITPRVHA
jgi:predicted dehydrogenase